MSVWKDTGFTVDDDPVFTVKTGEGSTPKLLVKTPCFRQTPVGEDAGAAGGDTGPSVDTEGGSFGVHGKGNVSIVDTVYSDRP